ncbi:MAG: enolase C-terminal domain-like protein [Candidatus Hydrogenedens sp.]
MLKNTDIEIKAVALYFIPIQTRVPLKFGKETLTKVTCARVALRVEDREGNSAIGWGETPLSVQWVWPSERPYVERYQHVVSFTRKIAHLYKNFDMVGHPIEIGYSFIEQVLPRALKQFNSGSMTEVMPRLAGLVCCSPFDLALHDAYGKLHQIQVYNTYNSEFMNRDLAEFLTPAIDKDISFCNVYPQQFLKFPLPEKILAWHLVGGLDWIDEEEVTKRITDNYPCSLRGWIRQDGLKCLKIKLRGNDSEWDYERIIRIGNVALEEDVWWLSVDFNCTVLDVRYVVDILDRLMREHPRIYGMILYVEQPFPYELEGFPMDVRPVSARKPLFMDESAHDWRIVLRGRELGWSGVALKTCKTQTGALLSLCWAKAHGLLLMVQDLTNPMLAQIPHVLLGAHAGTIMGVESNSMQFYPEASLPEAKIHPGLYKRVDGYLDLTTLKGAGFGMRVEEIKRELPHPDLVLGDIDM